MQYVQSLNSERSGRPKTEVLEEVSTDPAVSVCVYACACMRAWVCVCICVCVHFSDEIIILNLCVWVGGSVPRCVCVCVRACRWVYVHGLTV